MFDIEKTYKPKTLQALVEAMEETAEEGKIIAGGTDVVVKLREGVLQPKALIDISSVKEMQFIRLQEGKVQIGAGTTFSDLEDHPLLEGRLQGLKEGAVEVGSPQIRNAGTLGGNICNASPAADTVPPLLALDAAVVLKGGQGLRTLKLEDFFLGKGKVDLAPGEFLYYIEFDQAKEGQGLGFSKLGPRKALAISKICTAVYLDADKDHRVREIRIANGSVGPTSLREREVEEVLRGKTLTPEHKEAAQQKFKEVLNRRLKGRWDVDFKEEAIRGVFKEALEKAVARALV
ncbi:FAD binding domain-containing protein [Isachenkonia alkalipeptolytica]|uniref:Xanthine dehydrogenase family protein subunit M n=1 Tax=Isachenkonia alkalipeptolytica TaxID=2565777 RepID=A0AA44BFI0_9CLOT|nr:FAD binding domain-containing protein [Isachenkonia alkalipeptolytica]NBG89055.1 xanthine dehydrogenase family protein subunit M [Isachenkonia alkalipeptolytica]